ncbi:hypothetical protein ABK905_17650 [Acerihabitans sp. KWT182]|uniref:Uncharacterized protein n=1 Tax=Acerihabitans sp. KWT182 TaxID=3157919 RepID=A0AAU7Q5U6_9GAMM
MNNSIENVNLLRQQENNEPISAVYHSPLQEIVHASNTVAHGPGSPQREETHLLLSINRARQSMQEDKTRKMQRHLAQEAITVRQKRPSGQSNGKAFVDIETAVKLGVHSQWDDKAPALPSGLSLAPIEPCGGGLPSKVIPAPTARQRPPAAVDEAAPAADVDADNASEENAASLVHISKAKPIPAPRMSQQPSPLTRTSSLSQTDIPHKMTRNPEQPAEKVRQRSVLIPRTRSWHLPPSKCVTLNLESMKNSYLSLLSTRGLRASDFNNLRIDYNEDWELIFRSRLNALNQVINIMAKAEKAGRKELVAESLIFIREDANKLTAFFNDISNDTEILRALFIQSPSANNSNLSPPASPDIRKDV